jgi:hypothetical protein
MIKFDMTKKIRHSGFWFQIFRFSHVQSKVKKRSNTRKLEAKGISSVEKGNKASRNEDRRNSSLEVKSQKLDHPVWDSGLSDFSRTDIVRVGFEI